jgi:hypothetical protein
MGTRDMGHMAPPQFVKKTKGEKIIYMSLIWDGTIYIYILTSFLRPNFTFDGSGRLNNLTFKNK